MEVVRRVVDRVFVRDEVQGTGLGLLPRVLGDDGRYLWGDHDESLEKPTKETGAEWEDYLKWYHDGDVVGIIGPLPTDYYGVTVDRAYMKKWLEPWLPPGSFAAEARGWGFAQHLNAPRSSVEAIEAVGRREPPPTGIVLAPDDERVADFAPLAPAHAVISGGAKCLGFAREDGRDDVIRCRYQTAGMMVNQAMTHRVRALWVHHPHAPGSELAEATRIAATLFWTDDWRLREVGSDDTAVWGESADRTRTQDLARATLRWWATREGQIGFTHRVHEGGTVPPDPGWFAPTRR